MKKSNAPQGDLREAPTQVLSCKFNKIFQNIYFKELLRMAAICFMKISHLPKRDTKREHVVTSFGVVVPVNICVSQQPYIST